jgi:predicted Zn-dependent peptidase
MIWDWQKRVVLWGVIFYLSGFFIFSAAELSGKMYGLKKNGLGADYKGDKKMMKVQAEKSSQKKEQSMKDFICKNGDKPVYKKILKNGLAVLVRPMHTIPEVSLQIWYKVGSKDEKSGERGIAHLIEHMIFKGTQGKGSLPLSESDINIVVHKLSGSCNAFTSYDYTGYLFTFPTHNWKEALPIMADCMQHCAFKEDHLSSEMKAVIQELKLYRDEYADLLLNDLLAVIFPDHPYHYPIIGYTVIL